MIFMKNIKNIISFCLIFSLVFSLFALTGCGSGEKEYAVSVKDAFGTPYTSGVIVKFMDGDDQVAMQSINDKGIATKTIQGGSYRIVLDFTDSDNEYYYDNSIEVTEDSPKVDVIVSYKVGKESEKLSTNNGEFDAPFVNAGGTYVNLKEKSRNYFLFSPKQAGNYEISVINGKDIKIGYYGAPHFVQENSVAEVKDNKFSINVTQHNFPKTIQLGDVCDWKNWDIDWKGIDLLIGGSPCFVKGSQVYTKSGYKNIEDIVSNIGPTAEIIAHIKPIYNFKAADS